MTAHDAQRALITVTAVRDGHGVFAAADIAAGAFLGTFAGTEVVTPTRLSLQVGRHLHIDPAEDCKLAFLNHACSPAAAFRGRDLHAVRDIQAGTEITVDYNCHEDDMTAPFACACGGRGCVGRVAGWRHLDNAQRAARSGRVAGWLGAPG